MSNSEQRCTGAAYHYSTLARVLNHASQLLPTRVCSAIATLCAHLQLPECKPSMQVGRTRLVAPGSSCLWLSPSLEYLAGMQASKVPWYKHDSHYAVHQITKASSW